MNNPIKQFSKTQSSKNILTSNLKLLKNETYKEVSKLITSLIDNGLIHAGKGYCISMSDVIYTLLVQNKISCSLVECQLTYTDKLNNNRLLVGFDNLKTSELEEDVHVAVITNTDPPLLIDASIAHILPEGTYAVIDEVIRGDGRIICDIETDNLMLTYQEKKKDKIPLLHQKSIVNRINTDLNIFKNLRILKVGIIMALIISALNATRGLYEFYEVFVQDNNWGPVAMERINKKLEDIDSKLK
jgi:hypothetical protein